MGAILNIEKEQGKYAKGIAAKLNASIGRKKGMIDLLGVTLFAKFLKKHYINVNLTNCLHKFPFALEEYKITDVFYNGYKIFVVTVFNEKYIRIPKSHFQLGIQPDFYVIAEVDQNIEKGAIGGFVKPETISQMPNDEKFYYLEKNDIIKIEDLIKILKTPNGPVKTYGKHLEATSKFVKLADGELSRAEKNKLIKHLLTCESCTIKLKDFLRFDSALSFRQPKVSQMVKAPVSNNVQTQSVLDSAQKQVGSTPLAAVQNPITQTAPIPIMPPPPSLDKASTAQNPQNAQEAQDVVVAPNSPSEPTVSTEEHFTTVENTNTIDFLKKKFASKKEAIDLMFKDKNVFNIDLSKISMQELQKRKKLLVTGLIVLALLVAFSIGAGVNKSNRQLQPIGSYSEKDNNSGNYDNENLTDPGFYDDKYSQQAFDNNAFDYEISAATGGRSGVSGVKSLSWEVDPEFAGKDNYTKFLQVVGKNIKLSLQNELLLTPDYPRNNVIEADIRFASNGNVDSMKLVRGSGSQEIDNMIQKCIYETFSYIRPPKTGFLEKNLAMTLIIEF